MPTSRVAVTQNDQRLSPNFWGGCHPDNYREPIDLMETGPQNAKRTYHARSSP